MRTRPFLWSALLGIVLAFSGCIKDDIQKSTSDTDEILQIENADFSLAQVKTYVTHAGFIVPVSASLTKNAPSQKLEPIWEQAHRLQSDTAITYQIQLAGDFSPLQQRFGTQRCTETEHNHQAGEACVSSVLLVRKNLRQNEITTIIRTHIGLPEKVSLVIYSSIRGKILQAYRITDGKRQSIGLQPQESVQTKGGSWEWCSICAAVIESGETHPNCHICWNPKSSCTCGGGGTICPWCQEPGCSGQCTGIFPCNYCGQICDGLCPNSPPIGWVCPTCGGMHEDDYYYNSNLGKSVRLCTCPVPPVWICPFCGNPGCTDYTHADSTQTKH